MPNIAAATRGGHTYLLLHIDREQFQRPALYRVSLAEVSGPLHNLLLGEPGLLHQRQHARCRQQAALVGAVLVALLLHGLLEGSSDLWGVAGGHRLAGWRRLDVANLNSAASNSEAPHNTRFSRHPAPRRGALLGLGCRDSGASLKSVGDSTRSRRARASPQRFKNF